MKKHWFDLQLFAEGGDGGSSAGEGEGNASGEQSASVDIPASLPEKAKSAYKKAFGQKPQAPAPTTEQTVDKPTHVSYSDLIKSDEYKEEHKAYMEKTIQDRFKKYKGIEEDNTRMKDTLNIVANKYGLDASAEDFIDSLSKRIAEDDSYYENYAMEHDISVEEARKNIALEQKVKRLEAEEANRQQQAKANAYFAQIRQNAEKTKAMFPDFDLDTEMQNERFRNLLAATNGDTTAAYHALHWNNIIPTKVREEADKARQAMANSIAANQSRPIESGLSSQAATVVTPTFKGMNARELKAYAEANLRKR